MTDRSQTGWRESVWNQRQPEGPRRMGRSRLALEGAAPAWGERNRRLRPETGEGSTTLLRLLAAPWIGPARHRYQSGSRWLMKALEWVTAKAWPLSVLDDMCSWFEEESAASRIFVGCAAAGTMAALLSVHWAALYALQSVMLLPVLGGHGMLVLVGAAFVVGATLLPAVLGQVLGVLLRFYVLVNVCTLAALLGYGSWLLYSYVKF
jgi:hypothetical protein